MLVDYIIEVFLILLNWVKNIPFIANLFYHLGTKLQEFVFPEVPDAFFEYLQLALFFLPGNTVKILFDITLGLILVGILWAILNFIFKVVTLGLSDF